MVPRAYALALAVLFAAGAAGCAANSAATPTTRAPLPAGSHPSKIARMVCSQEAQSGIAAALGERASVSTPTWEDHLYSCTYTYPTGSFRLSVKELSSWSETLAYYNSLARSLGRSRSLEGLGQGAFQTTDGSVVVRKDWKVLLVDVSGLPAQFGVPQTSSGAVAVTVADLILGCWAGD